MLLMRLLPTHVGWWVASVPLLACVGCSACSGQHPTAESGGSGGSRDAAIESGDDGGAGGSVASGGSAGTDASTEGGGVDSGIVDPVWEPFGAAGGIVFEHLKNASDLRLFRWTPCPEVQNCQVAEFVNPALCGDKPNVQPTSIVNDDGMTVRAAIGLFRSDYGLAVAVDDEGRVLEGFRCRDPNGVCNLMMPGLWGKRFVVDVLESQYQMLHLALGSFDALPGSPTTIDSSGFAAGSPGERRMGTSRLVYRWTPGTRLWSVSNVDGADLKVFAAVTSDASVWEIGAPDSTGTYFIFDEALDVGGQFATRIEISDGITAAVPYIVPVQGEYVGSPRYAHSHVCWLRGTQMESLYSFGKVEIWASPFDPDPSKLQPYKVGDWLGSSIGTVGTGGHGKYAIPSDSATALYRETAIWDLAGKTVVYRMLPSNMNIRDYLGVTRTHLWMTGTDPSGPNRGDWLVRFTVQ